MVQLRLSSLFSLQNSKFYVVWFVLWSRVMTAASAAENKQKFFAMRLLCVLLAVNGNYQCLCSK